MTEASTIAKVEDFLRKKRANEIAISNNAETKYLFYDERARKFFSIGGTVERTSLTVVLSQAIFAYETAESEEEKEDAANDCWYFINMADIGNYIVPGPEIYRTLEHYKTQIEKLEIDKQELVKENEKLGAKLFELVEKNDKLVERQLKMLDQFFDTLPKGDDRHGI